MKKIISIALVAISIGSTALAQKDRGGGDACENRIKVIRDDISQWISKGGHLGLKLPNGISTASYAKEMNSQITKAKIECLGIGDKGFPIEVDGTAKICRFDLSKSISKITCDTEKFKRLSESEQYVLIHHEYAGLAQIEQPNGDDSDYKVSNQISVYLVDVIVKKLAVKPQISPEPEAGWRRLDMIEGLNSALAIQDILDRAQYHDCTFKVSESLISNCPSNSNISFSRYDFTPIKSPEKALSSVPGAFDCQGADVTIGQVYASYFSGSTQTLLQNKTEQTKFKQINYGWVAPFEKNVKKQLITEVVVENTFTKVVSVSLSVQEKRPTAGGSLGNPAYPSEWTTTQSINCHADK